MKRFIPILYLSLFTGCLLTSCGGGALSVQKKQNKLISQESYAISDSLKAGRVDLADKHSDLLVKLVPPPTVKDRVPIKPFKVTPPPLREKSEEDDKNKNLKKLHGKAGPITVDVEGKYFGLPNSNLGENIVVLPEHLKEKIVIVENSEQYKQLLLENEELRKQVEEQEKKLLEKQSERVDEVLVDKEKIVEKAAEKQIIDRNSFWGRLKFYGLIAILVGGIGALMFFIPPAIPVVLGIFNGFFKIIGMIFSGILNLFKKK